MIGAFSVGKTSLVKKFVTGFFSDRYQTTLGVVIEKKTVLIDGEEVDLILWDLAGEDDYITVKMSYLRGASGYISVVDGTRRDTLETALELIRRAEQEVGDLPHVVLVNKVDLKDKWKISEHEIQQLEYDGLIVLRTSAKTDQNVQEAFHALAQEMLARDVQKKDVLNESP